MVLGSVFIYASLDKIAYPEEFARIVHNYNILPGVLVGAVAYFLPWLELFLGTFLVIGLFVRQSAFVLSSLLLVFMILIGIKALNGTLENCGCFSMNSKASDANVIFLLLRDSMFLIFGFIIIHPYKYFRSKRTLYDE